MGFAFLLRAMTAATAADPTTGVRCQQYRGGPAVAHDGAHNEEREPDVRMEWRPQARA